MAPAPATPGTWRLQSSRGTSSSRVASNSRGTRPAQSEQRRKAANSQHVLRPGRPLTRGPRPEPGWGRRPPRARRAARGPVWAWAVLSDPRTRASGARPPCRVSSGLPWPWPRPCTRDLPPEPEVTAAREGASAEHLWASGARVPGRRGRRDGTEVKVTVWRLKKPLPVAVWGLPASAACARGLPAGWHRGNPGPTGWGV